MSHAGGANKALRAEEACLNGWPAIRHVILDGWQVRLSDGYTKRGNSINPLGPATRDPVENIRFCEAIYARHGLPTIFRISSAIRSDLDPLLDRLGYAGPEDRSLVLFRALAGPAEQPSSAVILTERFPSSSWLTALADIQGQTEATRRAHRAILEALAVPAVFGAVPAPDGRLAALVFGAVHAGLVCINSVATHPEFRRQGLAQKVIAAILDWARRRAGAEAACVPVGAANAPAVALYRSSAFATRSCTITTGAAAPRRGTRRPTTVPLPSPKSAPRVA